MVVEFLLLIKVAVESNKDILDVIEILGTILAATFIPITIFIIGHKMNRQKAISDEKARQIEQISHFRKHLTSDNENERIIALKISKYLHHQNQLPGELISAVEALTVTDEPSSVLASNVLEKDSISPENFWFELGQTLSKSRSALEKYKLDGRKYKYIKEILDNNTKARNLILINSDKIPLELRESISNLLRHYNDWIKGFYKFLSEQEKEPHDEEYFSYFSAPNFLFPKNHGAIVMDYIKKTTPQFTYEFS